VTSPDAEPLRLEHPDTAYRLSADDRAKLAPGFDAEALERLLRQIRPSMRSEILAHFQIPPAGQGQGQLVEIHDVRLQAILEEVWAPMWDDAPDEALEEGWYRMPGLEIARQRRFARARESNKKEKQ
jgi:hypothetical protein